MRWRLAGHLAGLAVAAGMAACSVAPNAVLKKEEVGENTFLATDARLRVVASSGIGPFSRPGQIDPTRVICTEPSPDVATVVATSFGAGISILGQGSGAISAQQVEGMMSLVERTASIQLLRDKMYQTCLAFANGAISGTSYAMIMARLDETILSFLLGETAGGAFGRGGGALGTEASAEAQATLIGLPAAMQELVKLGDELKVAQAETDKAKLEYDAAKADYEKAANAEPKPTEAALAPKKTEMDQKKTAFETAQKRRDELIKLAQSRAEATAKATGSVKTAVGLGGLTRTPNADLARVLRDMQEQFLATDLSRDVVSACLVEMAAKSETRSAEQIRLVRALGQQQRLQDEIRLLREEERKIQQNDKMAVRTMAEVQAAIAEHPAKLNAADEEVRKAQAALPVGKTLDMAAGYNERIFNRLDAALQADTSKIGYFVPNLAAISARDRTTALSQFCGDNLNDFMAKAQKNNDSQRMKKLENQLEVEKQLTDRAKAEAEAAKAQAAAAEAAAKKVHSEAVVTCSKIADATQQKACLAALTTITPPEKPKADGGGS